MFTWCLSAADADVQLCHETLECDSFLIVTVERSSVFQSKYKNVSPLKSVLKAVRQQNFP